MTLQIISFLILVITIVIMLMLKIKSKKIDRNQYEFTTYARKEYIIFANVFEILGIIANAICFLLSFKQNFFDIILGIMIIGNIIFFIGLIIFIYLSFNYKAIKNDKIVIHKFHSKDKYIDIKDIEKIEHDFNGVTFYKNNKKLFHIENEIGGIKEFTNIINTRINNKENDEQILKYELIGKRYRENSHKRKIFLILTLSITFLFFLIGSIFISIYRGNPFFAIFCIPTSLIIFTLAFNQFKITEQNELNKDNISLGKKHFKEDKKVIGHGKAERKTIFILGLISTSITGLIGIGSYYLGKINSPILKEELTSKTYHFKYVKSYKNYIAFGFYETETEYHTHTYCKNYFDKSFYQLINDNDEVTILIDSSQDRIMSYNNEQSYNYLYEISYNDKFFLTYDDYYESFIKNNNLFKIISFIFISLSTLSFITTTSRVICLNKKIKYEDIEL